MSNLYLSSSKHIPHNLIALTFIVITNLIFLQEIIAQTNQLVQVKAFSENLSPYPNLSISINNGEFIALNEKGTAFINLKSSDIPIQSIGLKDAKLEVASWNLSKGILEVIIRKKSYIDKKIRIVNENGEALAGVQVEFSGNKEINKYTDDEGVLTIPLALTEKIGSVDQFKIPAYEIQDFKNQETIIIAVKKIQMKVSEAVPKTVQKQTNLNDQDDKTEILLQQLDTTTTLKEFYELLYQIPKNKIDDATQLKLDRKLDSLLSEANDDKLAYNDDLLKNISDSTVVEEDIDNLLQQARKENKSMSQNRKTLETNIRLVRDKLNVGFENMSKDSKSNLLNEIEELETILQDNKNEFNKNLDTYLAVINEFKSRFFDLQELENRLSESERERLKEKKTYQQRLLLTLAIALVFAILIILLFYFRSRLKKQQQKLIEANKVVKITNENLENIVLERTFLLHKTFKELDTVLYKASHDLRAPLSSIVGISDLINRETNNKELTGLLLKTNVRMDKLLKKLSTISEIHQPGEFEEFDIKVICERVITSFNTIIKERGINFKVNIELEKSVYTIPKLVEVILYHLLENAFFFCWIDNKNRGEVELEIKTLRGNLIITVSDNGIGVQEIIKHKIFEMFYVGTEHSDGNGLGLYIVQKSAELLNGKAKVKTGKDGITKFIVQLPMDGKGSNTLEFLSRLKA